MGNLNKKHFFYALGAYMFSLLMVSSLLGAGQSEDHLSLIFKLFGGLIGATIVPFVISYVIIAKRIVPEIKKSQSLTTAMCLGTGSALILTVIMSLFAGVLDGLFSNQSMIGSIIGFLFGGLMWGLIPAILCGSGYGYFIYFSEQKNREIQREKV